LKNGFFAATNGIEMPFLYAAAALGLLLSGGAKYSLDTEFGLTFLGQPYVVVGLFVLAIVGAIVTLAVRRQPQTQTSAG
jgi:hypothetical protein